MNNTIFRMCMMLFLAAVLPLARLTTAQDMPTMPLAERGPYLVGERTITLVDESRDDREIVIELWYPALVPEGSDVNVTALQRAYQGLRDAPQDTSNTPYPLILFSHGYTGSRNDLPQFTLPLASHGFVVVGIEHSHRGRQATVIDRPLDILFVIDALAAMTDVDLDGLIDTDRVGVFGFSQGSYTALAVNGARIDPTSVQALTANPMIDNDVIDPRYWWPEWNWDELVVYREQFSPPLEDGELWPAFTDERILAVLPLEPCNSAFFGEQGLAAATVPTLLIAGTADQYCPYQQDAGFYYTHLGSEDAYLLTVIDADHFLYDETNYTPVISHFVAAFFGHYLHGQADYAQYLTSEYVGDLESQVDLGLVWGVYEGE
jgi:predicted dienelactone hydrolase